MKNAGKALIVGLLFVTGFAAQVVAGPFEDAGAAYRKGDYATALRLIRPLAEQGNPVAQHNLGIMYAKGQGVVRNFNEAARWYRKSAAQGYAKAQTHLGFIYAKGRGVQQNYAEAVKWFRMAAEQGVARAQFSLGLFYENGQGVRQDDVLAYMWYNLAASQPRNRYQKLAVKTRNRVAAKMTPVQIAQAQKLAREWRPKKAQPR